MGREMHPLASQQAATTAPTSFEVQASEGHVELQLK